MSNFRDSLGDRIKEYYENRTQTFLPRRTYTIIRIDGKQFKKYAKNLEKPFDYQFIEDMDDTAKYLCDNIQGCKFAFVQSDEISLVLTDFDKIGTEAWFDGNVQNITSTSSSIATAIFNSLRPYSGLAFFKSVTFSIPSLPEVINYFIWRQIDCVRKSIFSLGYDNFTSNELHGVKTSEVKEKLSEKGIEWDNLESRLKYGRLIIKEEYDFEDSKRIRWVTTSAPKFKEHRYVLEDMLRIKK